MKQPLHTYFTQTRKLLLYIHNWSFSSVTSALTGRGGDTASTELSRLLLPGDFRTAGNGIQQEIVTPNADDFELQ